MGPGSPHFSQGVRDSLILINLQRLSVRRFVPELYLPFFVLFLVCFCFCGGGCCCCCCCCFLGFFFFFFWLLFALLYRQLMLELL